MLTPTQLDLVLTWLLNLEDRGLTGSVENLGDGGGQTRFGITSYWGPETSPLITADFFTIPTPDALPIAKQYYKTVFWDKLKLDQYPMPLAASVLSCAVNCGPGTALHLLSHGSHNLETFIAAWSFHYRQVAGNDPSRGKFLDGWLKRATAVFPNLP